MAHENERGFRHWQTRGTKRAPKIRKGVPFGRVILATSSEDGEYITLRHATRGIKSRRATPHLFSQMVK